ncbi:transposase [Calothrix sp. NIES-4071]|nr:transposase [Calothrix sp. NIES-4071]BAZ57884.1 transposase [Calothrix sp. NIES-4105]
MKILENLLPDKNLLQLESCNLDEEQGIITLLVSSNQTSVEFSVCNSQTSKIHSHYKRKLADLSWASYSTSIKLHVCKFFCINFKCKRQIFTERLASIVQPWACRTIRRRITINSHYYYEYFMLSTWDTIAEKFGFLVLVPFF